MNRHSVIAILDPFRHCGLEPTHLMENVIFNKLLHRGYAVDVGVVEHRVMKDGKSENRQHEVNFIATDGGLAGFEQICLGGW